MNIPYFRDPYDPDIDDTQNSGGLLALLQAAMQRNAAAQASPDVAASQNSQRSYGFPQVRILARPVSLQGGQDIYQPAGADNAPTQSSSAGADFRQVSRSAIKLRPQRGSDAFREGSDGPDLSSGQGRGSASGSPGPDSGALAANNVARSTRGDVNLSSAPAPGSKLPDLSNGSSTQSLALPVPDALGALWTIYQLQRGAISGSFGSGNDNYNRCVRAVDGGTDDWENFCKYLERAQNNTVGGESQNRACWSKTYESRTNKKQWCENQFGSHD